MKIELTNDFQEVSDSNTYVNFALNCPHCGVLGTFESLFPDAINNLYVIGFRRCANDDCHGHLFFIYSRIENKLLITYPYRKLYFDRVKIPDKIANIFDEALQCYSNNCFTASAMMIRKTLEAICEDFNSPGNYLFEKIENLKRTIILPKELLDSMNEIRLMGDDADHIQSSAFNDIDEKEVEISIEFTKELLKAVYQYKHLLEKLKQIKKSDL